MDGFDKRLAELMDEKNVDAKFIAEKLRYSNTSTVYKWKNGRESVLLDKAVQLADIFQCSLDYLVGRSDDYGSGAYKECPPFGPHLKQVLKERNSSQNKLIKKAKISALSLNNWMNGKGVPHIDSVIKIADYLDVGLDYLVGRET